MKKSVLMLMVAGMFAATSVLAAEPASNDKSAKDCIQRCVMQIETIDQKIERLKSEIEKGKTTYSADEIRKLEEKLKEANYMLDSITKP